METTRRRTRRRHKLQRGCGYFHSFMRSSYGKRSSACRRNSFMMEQQTGASMVTLQASHRLHPPPPLPPLTVRTSSDDRSMHGPSDTANHHLQCWNETGGRVQPEHYLTLCCALTFTCSAATPASLCSCFMSAPSPCPRSSTLMGRKAILLRYRKSLLAVT